MWVEIKFTNIMPRYNCNSLDYRDISDPAKIEQIKARCAEESANIEEDLEQKTIAFTIGLIIACGIAFAIVWHRSDDTLKGYDSLNVIIGVMVGFVLEVVFTVFKSRFVRKRSYIRMDD